MNAFSAFLHPLFVAIVSLGLAVGAFLAAWRSWRASIRCLLALLGIGFSIFPAMVVDALFPWVLHAKYWTYRQFYRAIAVDMSHDEVLAVLARCYPSAGSRLKPTLHEDTPSGMCFFMNAEGAGQPNCEGIILQMNQGKVVAKRYSAD